MCARARSETAAVLTGDFVDSSKVAPQALETGMRLVAEVAAALGGPAARFTRFRGDGWQFHLAAPGLALRAALLATARLRAVEAGLATRAAIGIGGIGSLGGADLADAGGPAFEASGRALDAIPRGRRLALAGDGATPARRIVVDLLDERAGRWTAPQAEALALHLDTAAPTLAAIAERLGITPQAVGYRLAGAGGPTLRRCLRLWEADWAGEAEAEAGS